MLRFITEKTCLFMVLITPSETKTLNSWVVGGHVWGLGPRVSVLGVWGFGLWI